MSRKEKLIREGFDNCVYLEDNLFDDAITGVVEKDIVAYDYNYMFDALVKSGKYTNKTAVDYLSSIIDEVSKHIYPGNTYLTIPHIMNKPNCQLPKWHKIDDRDLPTKSGEYLTVNNRGRYEVLRYCVEDNLGPYDEDYDFEKDDNMINLKMGFNIFDSEFCEFFTTDSVVAWMEIPKYE